MDRTPILFLCNIIHAIPRTHVHLEGSRIYGKVNVFGIGIYESVHVWSIVAVGSLDQGLSFYMTLKIDHQDPNATSRRRRQGAMLKTTAILKSIDAAATTSRAFFLSG